jgi:hypothetical protein
MSQADENREAEKETAMPSSSTPPSHPKVPGSAMAGAGRDALAPGESSNRAKSLATGPGIAASSQGTGPAAPVAHPPRRPALAGRPMHRDYSVAPDGFIYDLAVEINGTNLGRAPVLVGNDDHLAIKLGDILDLLAPAMDRATYERLRSSKGADTFISFERIQAAGIAIRYDTVRDRLILGS